jgi:hypothetical protein
MITAEQKKILQERSSGTAVTSAQALNWRESVAFDPKLHIEANPSEVYSLNQSLYLSPQFVDKFKQGPDVFLQKLHLAEFAVPETTLTSFMDRQLNEEERETIVQILTAANGVDSQKEVEAALAECGYALPAIAILVLVVAIAIALWVYIDQ